jgi:hypothetical protein
LEEALDLSSERILIELMNVQSREMRWAGRVTRIGEQRGAYRVLVRKREGYRPLGKPRYSWEYIIKKNLQGMGLSTWTGLIWLGVRTKGGL